jgi:hypothetical protein
MRTRTKVGVGVTLAGVLAFVWHVVLPGFVHISKWQMEKQKNERAMTESQRHLARGARESYQWAKATRSYTLTLRPDGTLTRSDKPPDELELASLLKQKKEVSSEAIRKAAQQAPFRDWSQLEVSEPRRLEKLKKELGPFRVDVVFEDAKRNMWGQFRPILLGINRAKINHLRLGDVPIVLPVDHPTPLAPDDVEVVFAPIRITNDASVETVKKWAKDMADVTVVLQNNTKTPAARLLEVIRALRAAKVTVWFGSGPDEPNDEPDIIIEPHTEMLVEPPDWKYEELPVDAPKQPDAPVVEPKYDVNDLIVPAEDGIDD